MTLTSVSDPSLCRTIRPRIGLAIHVAETEEEEDHLNDEDNRFQSFHILTNENSSSLTLTPNTRSLRRDQEQDLSTWRHIEDRELPHLIRRYPQSSSSSNQPPISMTSHPDGRIQNDMHHAPAPELQSFFFNLVRAINSPQHQPQAVPPPINLQFCPPGPSRQLQDRIQNPTSDRTLPASTTSSRQTHGHRDLRTSFHPSTTH